VVKTWIKGYDGLRVTYGYEICYEDTNEVAITGETQHVCVTKEDFRPVSLRRTFPNWHEAYLKALE
ncbi:hypothetical protein AAC545_002227, partial [Listeria monocytogenes]